ncbi:MAG: type II toxin-antitoxin system VapC family toxin [Limnospira sp.]
MTPILVDSNVILDVLTEDPQWFEWSAQQLANFANQGTLVINPIIFAEVSIGFQDSEAVENALPETVFRRDPLPY